MRKTGLDILGDVRWGTHFCQFYKTKEDLLEILVPFFKSGLENNEFCIWVTSEPLNEKDATQAMMTAIPDFDGFLKKGQMEIIPHTDWYLKGGFFDSKRVMNGWIEKLNNALAKGYDGLRLTGNTFWLEKKDLKSFSDYEEEVNSVIGKCKIVAVCTYSLERSGASQVAELITTHQFAIMKREGKWDIITNLGQKEAIEALKKSEECYKLAENAANIGSWDWNILTGELKWSERIEPLFGFGKEKFGATYKAFLKSVHPDDRKRVINAVNACLANGKDYQIEHRIVWPDGSVHWVLETGKVIRDTNYRAVRMLGIVQDTTERKKAEDALKKEKEFSEKILSTMPDGMDIVDENLRIVYMNKALENAFGTGAIGKKCYEVYRTDKKQCGNCPLKSQLNGRTETLEVSGIKGGRTFTISHTAIMLNGKRHVLEIFNDVTERNKADEQLRLNSAALEAAANAILITDGKGVIIWVNPAFTKLTGYSFNEALGKNPRILKSGEHDSAFYKSLWGTILAGKTWKGETTNMRKDGSLYTEEMMIAPLRAEDGRITNFIAIKQDISERKLSEEKLKSLNEKIREDRNILRIIMKNTEAHLAYLDRDFNFVKVNSTYAKGSGHSAKELIGKNHFDIFPNEENRALFEKVRSTGEPLEIFAKPFAYNDQPDRGTLYWDWTLTPVKGNSGEISGFVLSLIDVTERILNEERIKKSLAEKETLLKEIHHRVKNNLQIILSLLRLQSMHPGEKESRITLKDSENRIRSMALVHETLYRSKDLHNLDVKSYIETLTENLIRSYKTAGLNLSLRLSVEKVNLGIDTAIPCGLIINELVSNSLKYAFSDRKKGEILVAFKQNGNKIELTVSDDGAGMPKGIDFIKTKSLGLQLVNTLAEQIGGKIEQGSGKGTKFKITFPQKKE